MRDTNGDPNTKLKVAREVAKLFAEFFEVSHITGSRR